MGEWLRLDPSKLDKTVEEQIRGVKINLLLSPNDVPLAVRGFYDDRLSRFVIEFRYLGDEPVTRQKQDENITLRVGRHSRRLLGIEVDVDRMRAQTVELQTFVADAMSKAIEGLMEHEDRKTRMRSYGVARDAISQRKAELLEELNAK